MNTQLLDLEEARRQLGYKNIQTVRRLCQRGELQAYKMGNSYKTTQAWIDDLFARRLVQASSERREA